MKYFTLSMLIFFSICANAIAGEVLVIKDIQFAKKMNQSGKSINLQLDLFKLDHNEINKSAIIFLAHGGSFMYGSRDEFDEYARYLAHQGNIVCAIDYRLIPEELLYDIKHSNYSIALLQAMEDMHSAITFIMDNKGEYGIDPNSIIVGGFSAGAVTALHYGYVNGQKDLAILASSDIFPGTPELLDKIIDPSFILLSKKYEINQIINISGSIFTHMVIDPQEPSIVSVFGLDDEQVPFGRGNTDNTGIISEGPELIHRTASEFGMRNLLITIDNADHHVFANGNESEDCLDCRVMVSKFINDM